MLMPHRLAWAYAFLWAQRVQTGSDGVQRVPTGPTGSYESLNKGSYRSKNPEIMKMLEIGLSLNKIVNS